MPTSFILMCVYVCMSACVRACRSICMSLVSLHVSCLSLSWCLFSRTDVCGQSSFIRSYENTLVRTVWFVCASIYMYVQTYLCVRRNFLSCVHASVCLQCTYARTDGRPYGRPYVCLYMWMGECNRQLFLPVCQLVLSVCICVRQSVGQYICPTWVSVSLNWL